MGQPRVFPLADKALGGTLARRLRKERDSGSSFAEIARELEADGIVVSSETVRKWCRDLGMNGRLS